MTPILVVCHLTIFEARRRKVLTAALLGGFAFLAVFSVGTYFANAEMDRTGKAFVERQVLLTFLSVAGLYATNFLSVLLAVLLPVDTLSGEIDSGVMQTLASKPVRRSDIVIGKWLGHGAVVSGYMLFLSVGVLLVCRFVAGHVAVNVVATISLMILEITLLITVTIAGGTRFNTVTNGVVALGFYGMSFIGGWIEQIGALAGIQSAKTIGIAVSLISPADALWRMAAYEMQPTIVRDLIGGPPFISNASVPNLLMVGWAAGFLILTLRYAVRSFARRAL